MTNPDPTHHSEIWAVLSVEEDDHQVWTDLVRAFTGSGAEAAANAFLQELKDSVEAEDQLRDQIYRRVFGCPSSVIHESSDEQWEEFHKLIKESNIESMGSCNDYRVLCAPLFHKAVPDERMLKCAKSIAKDWVHQDPEITEIYLVQQTDGTMAMISIQTSSPRDPVANKKAFYFSPNTHIPFSVGVVGIHPEDWAAGDWSHLPASFDPTTHDLVRIYPE